VGSGGPEGRRRPTARCPLNFTFKKLLHDPTDLIPKQLPRGKKQDFRSAYFDCTSLILPSYFIYFHWYFHGTSHTSTGTSSILHGTSMILHGTSSILHGTSMILHGTSSILHDTFMILHDTSRYFHDTSMILQGTSSILRSIEEVP